MSKEFQDWLAAFKAKSLRQGISASTLDLALSDLQPNTDIIAQDRQQPEHTQTIWNYLDRAVSPERITQGQKALAEHIDLLRRIEHLYGVSKEIIVAIWGLESAYGANRGSFPIIEALATLAFDARRRSLFEDQLVSALLIIQTGDITVRQMTGSWAGAAGHTQFMPTSVIRYAVDFDGDGRRNIWGDDPTDALASTANYLAQNGWRIAQLWGVEVTLPHGFDYALTGKQTSMCTQNWAQLGVGRSDDKPLPEDTLASVLLPAGARGPALLIFENFRVLATYNASDAYVIAVGHLADRIRGGGEFVGAWPRAEAAMTRAEHCEFQERLSAAGFDTRGIDGIFGPNTYAALQGFQTAEGLVADGYPTREILIQLRQ
ncbi:MAG: lytic murein transglycosylase [Paracoccaceae bacterium]